MIRAADEQGKRMTDDHGETLLPQAAEPHCSSSSSILDALDMAGVGEIDIAFERSPSHPRPATFD